MKVWTALEMKNKLEYDFDLQDETFVRPDEIWGYFNEAITEAEAEIITIDEDYLRTKYFIPLVSGQSVYSLPYNIYANKIRKIVYSNGSIIYEVRRYRRQSDFIDIAFTDQFGVADDYRYILINDNVGQAQLEIHPTSRDTAVLTQSGLFVPMSMRFIRNCARIAMLGELCNPELIYPAQVSSSTVQTYAGTSTIGIVQQGIKGAIPGSIAYVTGDQVQLFAGPGGSLPTGLTAGTTYYVIAQGSGVIKFATSLANALAGTAVTLSSTGSVYFTMQVAATIGIQNATLIDIPEFATFIIQWVKCRILEKEKDPGLADAANLLAAQKKMMVDTLTRAIPDDDDMIQGDFSFYSEMS